ncbi:MAG: hypothetical protein Kow0092_27220 [Deferrisomatales bacterium]
MKKLCRPWVTWLAAAALVGGLAAVASGQTIGELRRGVFEVMLVGNVPDSAGANSGWTVPGQVGPWIGYPQPPDDPDPDPGRTWWNQWYYNDPFDPTRRKVVSLWFDYEPISPTAAGTVDVTINWSTPAWSTDDAGNLIDTRDLGPPLTDLDPATGEPLLERLLAETIPVDGPGSFHLEKFVLPVPYNPEWVSVDVRGDNVWIKNGVIEHQCVPIPAAAWLLGSGLVGLIGLGRRRRKG